MKTLYFDCGMGAAGDMLSAALLELLPDPADGVQQLNALGIPGVKFVAEHAEKCGIGGTHMRVLVQGAEEDEHLHEHQHEHEDAHHHEHAHHHAHGHEHEHGHSHQGMAGIRHLVQDHLNAPAAVRQDILAVYELLSAAESKVHGVPVEEIHFHEVGTMDALADISAVCFLLHTLAPAQIVCSPVHVGSGQVRCAHGILPVPAPAAAELLKGIPIYGGEIQGELCTPTGAALLKHFVTRFGPMPALTPEAMGYGMGKKDFPRANCVRAILGETGDGADEVLCLACNLDDMSAEAIGFAMERLLDGGALDVWTTPIGMKKCRPGTMLSLLCRPTDRELMLSLLFAHTTTLGVREQRMARATLSRRTEAVPTRWGEVRAKISEGYGVCRKKYEFEDLARVARAQDCSLDAARQLVEGSRHAGA